MTIHFTSKTILYLSCVLLVFLALVATGLSSARSYIDNHPEKVLLWSAYIEERLKTVTLPMRMAELATQPADEVLFMPVYGVDVGEIADTWAAPRSGGRAHEGQDIFAERGTPVFSATPGYITRIRENELGGNTVSVMGSGGRFYYYAHLDRYAQGLAIGDEVTSDTVLGYVGNTGNAIDTPPHLHFGMYQRGEGAVNPFLLFKDR